jgi:hypothetical protein
VEITPDNAGKSITRAEQALDGASGVSKSGFEQTWDELATRLKRTRRCLTKWRDKFKDAADLPKARADGRHDVHAWLRFMAARNLADEPEEELGADVPTKAHWDRLRAKIGFEREVFAAEKDRLEHIEVAEISGAVGQMLAGFRTALNNLPASAARWVIGLRDFHQVKDKLQSEVDAVLQALGRCEYLENLVPIVVAKLYADRDEQFRGNLIECADGVLRELGRLALSDLLQRALPNEASEASAGVAAAAATPDPEIVDQAGKSNTTSTRPDLVASAPSPKSRPNKRSRKK